MNLLFLFLFFILTSPLAPAQAPSQSKRTISCYDYFNFQSPSSCDGKMVLTIKQDKLDVSDIIRGMRGVKESDYEEDLLYLDMAVQKIQSEEIPDLCAQSQSPQTCVQKATEELQAEVEKINKEKEGQMLYPKDYRSIYNRGKYINDVMLKDAHAILDSECLQRYSGSRLSKNILNIHPNHWTELYDKLKYKDKAFLKNIVSNMFNQLMSQAYLEQCLDPVNKNHRVCKGMKKNLIIKVQRFEALTKLAYGPDELKTTEAQALCFSCEESGMTKELYDLHHLFSFIGKHSQCSDPKPGEVKQMIKNEGHYTVRKELDGSYSIPLNLEFSADEDYDGEVPRDQVPAHYRNKVQECLKKASTKMLGPNGEKLKLVIESPPEKNTCKEEPKTIKIGSKNHRSYVTKYEADIDCPIITHEILHLTGLCDEYKETSRGFFVDSKTGKIKKSADIFEKPDSPDDKFMSAYDCRVTSENSIMSDHYEKWENVFSEENDSSLLNKGQFNAILYGNCQSKNQLFNECADLAYKSSVHNKGCLEQKRKCLEQNVTGKDKAKELSKLRDEIKSHEETREDMLDYRQKDLKKDPQIDLSWYDDQIQEMDSDLRKLKQELKMVESWPDPQNNASL